MRERNKTVKPEITVGAWNIEEEIAKRIQESPEFAKSWEESREEYRLIGEMISIRRRQKMTQTELAKRTGNKQQVISRIEKKENSPTLKVFCKILDALGYELRIVKKHKSLHIEKI